MRLFPFLVPPLVLLALAFLCLDYAFTARHRSLVGFFLFGGHVVVLGCFFALAVALTQRVSDNQEYRPDGIRSTLAVSYLATTVLAWLMAALGVVSWP